jgi:molybdopterin-guanine dinucleotide biosynthesis protein A
MSEAMPEDADLRGVTLAVLAGGEGSRMGHAKGLLTISGKPILLHILETVRWPGPTLLVTGPGRQSPPGASAFDAEAVDPVAGQGPMRGVLTALQNTRTEWVVVLPVDMPALGAAPPRWLAAALLARPEALLVLMQRESAGTTLIEPLPAALCRGAGDLLRSRLQESRRSLHGLAGEAGVTILSAPADWPVEAWTNLNHPADWSAYDRQP